MMDNEIVIKLKGAATARKYEENELFQKEKFKEIRHILEVMLKEISGKECDSIEECRNHDTIFVNGKRGTGKTAFLLNIEDFIRKSDNNEKIYNKLKFFRPVDPTLLENSENFLSIVIARIIEEINNKLRKENCFNNKDKYFSVLNDLGNCIGAIKELKDEIGLDEIASYASSIKLEEQAHKFFKTACEIFEVEKLIVLIDDVDMAFDKGFEVLEVIRKYLASPYIIPIVAGDYNLYRDIVRNRFRKQFIYYKEEFKDEMEEKIDNMTEQYLQKVFPMEFRIELNEIKNILENNKIKINIEENYNLDFNKVIKFDRNSINLGINRKEEQFEVIEYNTRKLTKYLYRKKDIFESFKNEIEKETIPDINNLKDSYEAGAEFYKYDENEEKRFLSKLLDNDVDAFKSNKYHIYEAFLGLEQYIKKEELNEDFYITKNTKNQEYQKYTLLNIKLEEYETLLVKLFSDDTAFSSYQKRLFLISGKFLRLMIKSFELIEKKLITEEILNELIIITNQELNNYDNLKKCIKEYDEKERKILQTCKIDDDFLSNINEILYSLPYGIEYKDVSFSEEDEESGYLKLNDDVVRQLAKQILIWNHLFIRKNNFLSVSLYKIINKFFENINSFKHIKKLEQTDKPYNYFLRVILIFLNSIAYFENDSFKFVKANVAMSTKLSLKNFFEKDNAFFFNVKPLLEKESFTKSLVFHPIIRYFLLEKGDNIKNLVKNINEIVKEQKEEEQKKLKDKIEEILSDEINKLEEEKNTDNKINLLKKLLSNIDKFSSEEISMLKDIDIIKNAMKNARKSELKELVNQLNKKIEEAAKN